MGQGFRFAEIERQLTGGQPGVYEIHTRSGVPLKVGIAADLRKRLLQHRASRQSALKLKPDGRRSSPDDVLSKQSVLAKHLYYDEAIAPSFDLTSEVGRRDFLERCCMIVAVPTSSREAARVVERQREASGAFRYVGRVRIRRAAGA